MLRILARSASASFGACHLSSDYPLVTSRTIVSLGSFMASTSKRQFSERASDALEQDGFTRRLADSWDNEEMKTLPEHLRPIKGETLDLILRQKVYLLQSRRGYRANVDTHMLAVFASNVARHTRRAQEGTATVPERLRVLDLGAGNGLVSILFAKAHGSCEVHLVELQPQLADRARRNLQLNDMIGTVIQHDLKNGELPSTLRGGFDVVLINPPFYPDGSRKAPKNREKYLAHMETTASLSDFLSAANSACNKENHDAFVAVIHDRKELPRLRRTAKRNGFNIHASREVVHLADEEPSRILLQLKPKRDRGCLPTVVKMAGAVEAGYSGAKEHQRQADVNHFKPSLPPLILHECLDSQSVYTSEIEDFLERLPFPSLRIGRLRQLVET